MNMRTQEDYWDWFKTTLTEHSVNLKAIEKSMDKIEELLKEQNGRIKTNEQDLVKFKTAVSVIIFFVTLLSGSGLVAALMM
tara:strand:+ start:168 stop:410 length:243 start_codon:yes stop_codon:yes gene_type:complete